MFESLGELDPDILEAFGDRAATGVLEPEVIAKLSQSPRSCEAFGRVVRALELDDTGFEAATALGPSACATYLQSDLGRALVAEMQYALLEIQDTMADR